MHHHSLVRTIYLYLFAIVGLTLLTIGSVRFIDMGLKAFVFKQADEQYRVDWARPTIPYPIERMEQLEAKVGSETLTEEEKIQLKNMLTDYKNWEENREKINILTARRHRDASVNLAMLLVGLPLYLFHWRIIKKETKNGNS